MSRIAATFASLRSQNRKALITFIMGGDPNLQICAELLAALPAAGADIMELGLPFSDPVADGVTIQQAGKRALAQGATVRSVMALVKDFRSKNDATPIVLMGYFNPIYRYGIEKFFTDAAQAGVDGVIIVDVPPEEASEIKAPAVAHDIDFVRLIAPTTGDQRIKKIAGDASGFIYYIAVTGVTGGKSATDVDLQSRAALIRSLSGVPLAMGFGIKTPDQVEKVAAYCDAVVVGSALVDVIARDVAPSGKIAPAIDFVQTLSAALHN